MVVSLQSYLSFVRKNISQARLVILGNEAADLDSMASAIAYGFLRSLQDESLSVLPVMPIPRADFVLRSEAVYLCQEAGVSSADLVFYDEVDLETLLVNGAGLVLVDHNELCPSLRQYADHVVGILDHHKDAGLYLQVVPRVIKATGSTGSLVAMEFDYAGIFISQDVARLLCGTILLDTVNLDAEAGRVTDMDRDMVTKLLPLCGISRQGFFETIQREKFNVAGLSTSDLLRKDYKGFFFGRRQWGMSSVLLSIADWLRSDSDLITGLVNYRADKNLDLLLIMTGFLALDFCRELVVCCRTEDEQIILFDYLQKNGLALTAFEIAGKLQNENGLARFYRQGNVGFSRKKLQPLLEEFYRNRK